MKFDALCLPRLMLFLCLPAPYPEAFTPVLTVYARLNGVSIASRRVERQEQRGRLPKDGVLVSLSSRARSGILPASSGRSSGRRFCFCIACTFYFCVYEGDNICVPLSVSNLCVFLMNYLCVYVYVIRFNVCLCDSCVFNVCF